MRVVNRALASELVAQFGLLDRKPLEAQWQVGGPLASIKITRKRRDFFELGQVLPGLLANTCEQELRERGLLRAFRPYRQTDFWNAPEPYFVYEEVVATPVYISLEQVAAPGVPGALNVWVADPIQDQLQPVAESEFDWIGAFLYLVEELQVMDRPPALVSGISALRMLIEFVYNQQLPNFMSMMAVAYEPDEYGRSNAVHPLQKLEGIGGRIGRPRTIETVYRIAYMTDEQSYVAEGIEVRTNDILAYPLYICE